MLNDYHQMDIINDQAEDTAERIPDTNSENDNSNDEGEDDIGDLYHNGMHTTARFINRTRLSQF